MVSGTVVSAGTELGVTPWTVSVITVAVRVAVGGLVVGDAIATVFVGGTVGETGVTVGVIGVRVAGGVAVLIGVMVGVIGVKVGKGVKDAIRVAVGVKNIGAPNSLQPRSGAAPVYPVIGWGGIGSPSLATY